MTDAEQTIKHSIFDAITSNWHKKNDPNFAEIIRDAVFEKLFDRTTTWAIEEYMIEINMDNK